jgi:hypothetical protein
MLCNNLWEAVNYLTLLHILFYYFIAFLALANYGVETLNDGVIELLKYKFCCSFP